MGARGAVSDVPSELIAPELSKVWITRTAPFNRLTARHVRSWGFDPLIEPVLGIRPLAVAGIIAVPDALVFTSLHGVRLHRFFPSLAAQPVFAVGQHTARFARLRGYQRVASASGDVHDLRRLIRARLEPGAAVLHLSAAQPAGDLVGALNEDGYAARRQNVYEALEASEADLEGVARALPSVHAILIHSPRAGRRVAAWLAQRGPDWSGSVCCISRAAAAPFHEIAGAKVFVAARPSESAMIELGKEALMRDGQAPMRPLSAGSPG